MPSRKNFDLLCEILSKDLFLAKCFLIVEAIEGNTLQTIKMVSIRTAQSPKRNNLNERRKDENKH